MIEISLKSWAPFAAQVDEAKLQRWLKVVGEESVKAFKKMGKYPPASRPSQYPSVRTGRLRASITSLVQGHTVIVGSHMPYSIYLREGTIHMPRRKMSDNALQEGIEKAKKRAGKWVGWSHGMTGKF
jgi:phage gpG-like protein